jgi:site-specific recombinase XerD
MIAYSSRLRVSEVVKLKAEDIDSKRMLIHINKRGERKKRQVHFAIWNSSGNLTGILEKIQTSEMAV